MEHHPRCFVPSQCKLALEKQRRDAARVGAHQIGGPEPYSQRGLRVMKDRVGRKRNLMPTRCTLPASLFCQVVGISVPTARTHEAIRPATSGKILPARFFAAKLCLKFA